MEEAPKRWGLTDGILYRSIGEHNQFSGQVCMREQEQGSAPTVRVLYWNKLFLYFSQNTESTSTWSLFYCASAPQIYRYFSCRILYNKK